VLAVLSLAALSCGPWACERSAAPPAPRPGAGLPSELQEQGWVGDPTCAGCHEEAARSYAQSPHGRSLVGGGAIAPLLQRLPLPAELDHPASGFHYSLRQLEGSLELRETYALPGGEVLQTGRAVAALVLGSGRRTHTSLWQQEIPGGLRLRQLPVTFYTVAGRWDLSPGYDAPQHQRLERGASERCLFCHSGLAAPLPGEPWAFRAPLPGAIACERCHGPGLAHLRYHEAGAAAGPDPIVNPARLPPARAMDVCNSCHLEGRSRVLREGRSSIWEFRPGEPLGDTLSVWVEATPQPALFTHSSQGERFALSSCPVGSERLQCTSCHPAHAASPRDPGPYNAVCLGCHRPESCSRSPLGRADRKGPKDPCSDCHMQWGGTSDVPHVATVDHWIRRPEPPAASAADLPADPAAVGVHPHHRGDRRLVPVPLQTTRPYGEPELARAEAEAYLEYGQGLRAPDLAARARARAAAASAAEPGSAAAWLLLGRAELAAGRVAEAARALARSVALRREQPAAWELLGRCRWDEGRPSLARSAYLELLRQRPCSAEALERLGFLELRDGQRAAAEARYRAALRCEPERASAWHNLAALLLLSERLAEAQEAWGRAQALDPTLPRVAEGLAEVLERLGQPAAALVQARQGLRLLPGDEGLAQRAARLEAAAAPR